MKNRYLSTRIMAIMMAAAMAVSAAPAAGIHPFVDRNPVRQLVNYRAFLCDDPDCIWKNVQAVYVHSHRTDPAGNLCRGTNPVCREELYPFLRRGMSGRCHHRTGLHHLFGVCGESAGRRGYQSVCCDDCLELHRGAGL